MITHIKIHGFKTFQNFEMDFTPLTVIAGVNASGKSNLFDCLKLLSRLAETDLKTAFSEQRGNPSELFTQFEESTYAEEIHFVIQMLVSSRIRDNWGGESELKYTRLKYELKIKREINEKGFEDLMVIYEQLENLKHNEDQWVKNNIPAFVRDFWRPQVKSGKRGKPYIETEEKNGIVSIKIPQDGRQGGKATPANAITQTVLSGINSVDFPHAFAAKEEMRSWKFLHLNPEDLREPTRQDVGIRDNVTSSGKNLAAALYRIKLNDPYTIKEISRKLNEFLPNFVEVFVENDKANKQFIIKLLGEDGREFSSRVLSEGTLRILALCILDYDYEHQGLLCFEEPENGIHPFRIITMAKLLKDLTIDFKEKSMPLRQVIVNTHSSRLVGELFNWKNDSNVSIFLSQLHTQITFINNKKLKIKITKYLPVIKDDEKFKQLNLPFSEEIRKLTLLEVKKYLDSSETEVIQF
ncbi:MAG TPA: AAA family ATPase [Flavilitoribacter sp.]|nr:AAA family ATPase [Flavilitoribacter sp.]HMQ88622.1 AAA family ATPase [Flavilitoribacter sp.]